MAVRILEGDCRDVLAELPTESAHCVVTSPPYWGLRDYGVAGQLGLEADFRDYIVALVAIFREARRVLRADGTLWLNLGDSYAGSWGVEGRRVTESDDPTWHSSQIKNHPKRSMSARGYRGGGLKPKDLMLMPARVALALQEDGWWVRRDIIWAKPNPMPESCNDRCTSAHEYLFHLSKSARYYYDAAAIREPAGVDAGPGVGGWATGDDHTAVGHNIAERSQSHGTLYRRPNAPDAIKSPHGQGFTRRAKLGGSYGDHTQDAIAGMSAPMPNKLNGRELKAATGVFSRNKRSVWTIATTPFGEAHFATFPPKLIEPCILAGCPLGGTVLDPFLGAGTTALVADRLGRDCIGIELNPEYAAMARKRWLADAGMFAEVAAR